MRVYEDTENLDPELMAIAMRGQLERMPFDRIERARVMLSYGYNSFEVSAQARVEHSKVMQIKRGEL